MTWRVGRKVGRTIYFQVGTEPSDNDQLLGLMDTPELAERVVTSVNNWTGLLTAAQEVWGAFLVYGPVDDGRPEGDRFDAALTALMHAVKAAGGKRQG